MWASAPTTTRATAYECAGDFYKNSCIPPGATRAIRPYQLHLILAVGALRLWNLPKHPAHAEAAQEVQLFSARFFRVEQQNACVIRLVPKKAVAAGKIFREVRRIPRDQCVRCGFVKRHSDTRETGNGKQHTDGRKIHPKSAAPDREQSAQVSFQTAAGNLRVAPDGRGIWHCCLNRLQQPCVAAARRFAKQITASKVRWRHRTRREQVQFRGGLLFSSSKPVMLHSVGEPGGNGYRIMDKPPFL